MPQNHLYEPKMNVTQSNKSSLLQSELLSFKIINSEARHSRMHLERLEMVVSFSIVFWGVVVDWRKVNNAGNELIDANVQKAPTRTQEMRKLVSLFTRQRHRVIIAPQIDRREIVVRNSVQ